MNQWIAKETFRLSFEFTRREWKEQQTLQTQYKTSAIEVWPLITWWPIRSLVDRTERVPRIKKCTKPNKYGTFFIYRLMGALHPYNNCLVCTGDLYLAGGFVVHRLRVRGSLAQTSSRTLICWNQRKESLLYWYSMSLVVISALRKRNINHKICTDKTEVQKNQEQLDLSVLNHHWNADAQPDQHNTIMYFYFLHQSVVPTNAHRLCFNTIDQHAVVNGGLMYYEAMI